MSSAQKMVISATIKLYNCDVRHAIKIVKGLV